MPWADLKVLVELHDPKGETCRPPVGLERMLGIYLLQQRFDLSDPAVEDALYDSVTTRRFVGIDLGVEPAPDATTVCKFRHLLELHGLRPKMLTIVNSYLAHVASMSETKLIHSVKPRRPTWPIAVCWASCCTATRQRSMAIRPIRGRRRRSANELRRQDHRRWRTKLHVYPEAKEANRLKSKIPSRVEHVFGVLKLRFGFARVRYRGLAKNLHRIRVTYALINLYTVSKRWVAGLMPACA